MAPCPVLVPDFYGFPIPPIAKAASYKTQSQVAVAEGDAISNAAREMAGYLQRGDVQALKANMIPAVAADFAAIEGSAESVRPLVQKAAITVDSLYLLDAFTEPVRSPRTEFYHGTPLAVLNFAELPPAKCAVQFFTLWAVHNRSRFHSSFQKPARVAGCLPTSSPSR